MADRLGERENNLKQYHKQSADLTKQLDHPFEHEEKLTAAAKRQQEIVNALDITKNQASVKMAEEPEQAAEVVAETSQQNPRKGKAIRQGVSA